MAGSLGTAGFFDFHGTAEMVTFVVGALSFAHVICDDGSALSANRGKSLTCHLFSNEMILVPGHENSASLLSKSMSAQVEAQDLVRCSARIHCARFGIRKFPEYWLGNQSFTLNPSDLWRNPAIRFVVSWDEYLLVVV